MTLVQLTADGHSLDLTGKNNPFLYCVMGNLETGYRVDRVPFENCLINIGVIEVLRDHTSNRVDISKDVFLSPNEASYRLIVRLKLEINEAESKIIRLHKNILKLENDQVPKYLKGLGNKKRNGLV